MKLGLIPVNVGVTSVAQMVGLAQLAESQGFESVWTFEHTVVPLDYASKYPYNASGKMGADPDTNFIDPLIAIAHLAAGTSTLKFGTGVNILPQANPIYVAKQAASLDFVSDGRFILGVGIGWLEEEFDACGVPFARRGARFDDYMEGMRKIWSGEVVEHAGEFVQWSGFKSFPAAPSLPVVMGGNKGKAFDRIAQFGDGWFAPTTEPGPLQEDLSKLNAACEAQGRDPAEIEITCMWTGQGGEDAIGAMAQAGAHRLLIPLPALGPDPVAGIQKVAEEHLA